MTNNRYKYKSFFLIHEGNIENFLSSNPDCLSMGILIKARYGNSILLGKSFTDLANKLKISNKKLESILQSPCSESLFEYKDLEYKKIVKVGKINGIGKNIRFKTGGKEYFNTRIMEVGLGDPEKLTIKKINEILFLIKLVILVNRQNMAQNGVLMLSDSTVKSGVSFRDDYKVWTGCSIRTMAMKMGMSKYKARKVIGNAVKNGIITRNERKIIYEREGGEPGMSRSDGMFRIEYENGKVMEQLSNEYHVGKIRFRMKKTVSKSKLDKNTGKIRKWKRPVVKVDPNIQPWEMSQEYSRPDIIGTKIVCVEMGNGKSYARTDNQKYFLKSLYDSKNSVIKKAAKEMVRSLTEREVVLPYSKPDKERKSAFTFIKRLTNLHRKSCCYTMSGSDIKAQKVVDKFFHSGIFREYEVIATAFAIQKYQISINKQIDRIKKEEGANCKLHFFKMDDELVKIMVRDGLYMDKVGKSAIPVLKEFMARFNREDGGIKKDMEISMRCLFLYLFEMLGKYIYEKKIELLGHNDKAVCYRKYMENEVYGSRSTVSCCQDSNGYQ